MSFPFVSFDSILDENPCRFQIQTLVTFPNHPHCRLHFLLPLPMLNSTWRLLLLEQVTTTAQSGSGPAVQQHPRHLPPQTECETRPRPAGHAPAPPATP